MLIQNLDVATRLRLMTITFCLSGFLGVVGAMEITKGADMHKLNFLHVKYNHLFNNEFVRFCNGNNVSTAEMKQELMNIRQQPVDCLGIIGPIETLVMSAIGTERAIDLCKQDLALADRTIKDFEKFELGEMTQPEFIQSLADAVSQFAQNSADFEPLVETTVNTVSTIVIASVVLKALFVALFGFFMSRSIGRDYQRLQLAESSLEKDFKKRIAAEKERDKLNFALQDAAREAGKSEVATGVLHNVGNVLNSVNVSAHLIRETMSHNSLELLEKAADVIHENKDNLANYLTKDDKGKHFPKLLKRLVEKIQQEKTSQEDDVNSISKNIEHIKSIVSMQQTMAKKQNGFVELIDPKEVFLDAIKLNELNIQNSGIEIKKHFQEIPKIESRRHEILQILTNLIKNAHQAVAQVQCGRKTIKLYVEAKDNFAIFRVEDNGIGITPENQHKIFQHGFTTKASGHGFGLHSCANFAQDMGGSLTFESEGNGCGATFILSIPTKPKVEVGEPHRELSESIQTSNQLETKKELLTLA